MESSPHALTTTEVTERRAAWPMYHDLGDPNVMNAVVKENIYTPVPSPDALSLFASGLSFIKDGFQDIVEVCVFFLIYVFFASYFLTGSI